MKIQKAIRQLVSHVIESALSEIEPPFEIYTFALYFDHESKTLSVCVDSEQSSQRAVVRINKYNSKQFHDAVARSDHEMAALWQANLGRSLSLGDFALVNLARTDVPQEVVNDSFFGCLLNTLIDFESRVLDLIPEQNRWRVIFTCSTSDSEVGLMWTSI